MASTGLIYTGVLLVIGMVILAGVLWVAAICFVAYKIMNQGKFVCLWDEAAPSIYQTHCDRTFYTEDDGRAVHDWLTYCPFCSGMVLVKHKEKHD